MKKKERREIERAMTDMNKHESIIVTSLREFCDAMDAGKPVQQTIMRRMKVKGKTVFTREKVKAPISL